MNNMETVSNLGVVWVRLITADRERGMKWRVMVELTGSDGIVRLQEVSAGGTNASECSAATVGLTLADAKRTLAGLQRAVVMVSATVRFRSRRAILAQPRRKPGAEAGDARGTGRGWLRIRPKITHKLGEVRSGRVW
jgi:hypothetical protein